MMQIVPKIKKQSMEKLLKLLPEPHFVDVYIYKETNVENIDEIKYSTHINSGRMQNPSKKKILQLIEEPQIVKKPYTKTESDGRKVTVIPGPTFKVPRAQLKEAHFYIDALKIKKSKNIKTIYGGGQVALKLSEYKVEFIVDYYADKNMRKNAISLLEKINNIEGVPIDFKLP